MCALCIVSVAARGPCLRSASPYSFVKCSFECGLVAGGVEGDRWQQQASLFLCLCFFIFLFFFIASLPSPSALALSLGGQRSSEWKVFKMHDVVLANADLARRRWH